MKRHTRLHQPVASYIPSQLSANRMSELWHQVNDFSHIEDKNGHSWHVEISAEQPINEKSNMMEWKYTLKVTIQLGREELLANEVFDPALASDQRLMDMLEGRAVPMELKPVSAQSEDKLEAQKKIVDAFYSHRKKLQETDMTALKRNLIVQWVERKKLFASDL